MITETPTAELYSLAAQVRINGLDWTGLQCTGMEWTKHVWNYTTNSRDWVLAYLALQLPYGHAGARQWSRAYNKTSKQDSFASMKHAYSKI
jgi:hypothetical protein